MVILMQSIMLGAFHVGMTTKAPSAGQLTELAQQMFRAADLNMDNEISIREYIAWAHSNMTSQLVLSKFAKAAPSPRSPRSPRGGANSDNVVRFPAIPSATKGGRSTLQVKLAEAHSGRRSSMEQRTAVTPRAHAAVADETKDTGSDARSISALPALARDTSFTRVRQLEKRARQAKMTTVANRYSNVLSAAPRHSIVVVAGAP